MRNAIVYISILLLQLLNVMPLWSAILTFQFVCILQLLFWSKNEITYLTLISNLAIFQWLIGPLVYYSDYNPGMVLEITQMQVGFHEYFTYAWPATSLLVIGLQLSKPNLTVDLSLLKNADSKRFKFLIVFGLFFNIISIFSPLSLRFILKILTYLIYVGLLGLLIKEKKTKNDISWICIVSIFVVFSALKSAMFGELVFLILLFLLIFFYKT